MNSPKITEDLRKGKDRVVKLLDNAGQEQQTTESGFPTFTNPFPQSTPPEHNQTAQSGQRQGPEEWLPFRTTEDGFFVLPAQGAQSSPTGTPPQPKR